MNLEKKITRKEVNVYIHDRPTSSSSSSSKFANQGKNLIVGNSTYSIPDANSLATKYGVNEETSSSSSKYLPEQMEADLQQKELKIQQLENALYSMKTKIEEKNHKIEHLCVLLEALEPIPGVNPAKYQQVLEGKIANEEIDLRDSKIVSLAKKSHKLTMQVNKEKTINTQLNEEINEWKRRYEGVVEDLEKVKVSLQQKNDTKVYNRNNLQGNTNLPKNNSYSMEGETAEDPLMIIQSLQKQVKEGNRTIEELKKKSKELADENTKLTATLKKEIGEGITVEQAVDSGWRGRAQQIVMLKSRIKQLEANQGNPSGSTYSSTTVNRRGGSLDVDSKAEESLQEMSRERRQIVEALTEERLRLIESNQALEKKSSGQKARIQILENEMKKMKDSIQVALDKSSTDDQLIEALRGEVNKLQQRLQSQQKLSQDLQQKVQHQKRTTTALINGAAGHGTFSSYDDSMLLASQSLHQATADEESQHREQQYQAEITRLQRLCRNQSEQLDSQDVTIRDLRKQLKPY